MVSSSGLPVACLLVAGSPKSFNLEERILHLPTTTLHRDQVPCISTKPTEGDSGPRVGVMSALTETNKVRGNIRENPIDVSLRAEDELHSSATEHLKPRPSGLTVTGGATCASPAAEPPPTYGTNENEEQSEAEEEEVDGKDIKAPLDLVIEFLGAVMDRDVQLASRLCQMILLHEPDNPEARQFLPLIQEKLLEEHEMERSTEDDDDNDSGSDEESSSSSPSSSPSEEEEEG